MKSICHILTISVLLLGLATAAQAAEQKASEDILGCTLVTLNGEGVQDVDWVAHHGDCNDYVNVSIENDGKAITVIAAAKNINPDHT